MNHLTDLEKRHPNWKHTSCSCRGTGHQWGYGQVEECSSCKGWCSYWVHKPTGIRAAYPGGPFV